MTDNIKNKILFARRVSEFRESDQYSYYLFLHEARHSISIVRDNFIEIKKLIRQNSHNTQELKLWNFADPRLMWRAQRKLSRLLSNYLSSMFSHIDYTRNNLEPRLEQNPMTLQMLKTSKEDYYKSATEYKFIQDLRNYIAHKTHLKITSELAYNIEWDEPRRTIYITKVNLDSFKKWTSESKAFLSTQSDKVYIYDIIKGHFQKFYFLQDKIYLMLLIVNQLQTIDYIDTISKLYYDSVTHSCNGLLPFGEPYIRYLNYILRKSTSPNMGFAKGGV